MSHQTVVGLPVSQRALLLHISAKYNLMLHILYDTANPFLKRNGLVKIRFGVSLHEVHISVSVLTTADDDRHTPNLEKQKGILAWKLIYC